MQGMPKKGIKLLEVEKSSIAEKIGLEPGDEILTVNGHELPDELALQFHLAEGTIELCVRRQSGQEKHFRFDSADRPDLGVKVEEFQTKTCNNSCIFCFVDQLPQGVRPGLKLKDDDYRLSFLHGNYVTLTNLQDKELDRIVEQRLSPLYVSVHSTDPELRARILGRRKPDNLERKLRKLAEGNIRIHAQVVLVPGINDGKNLEKTVFDLFAFYPGVESVAIVPLGLSGHGKPKELLTPIDSDFCRKVIDQTAVWQSLFRAQIGRTFSCLADEFYLQGERAIPDREYYDDFAQIEDGIGMVRSLLDDFEAELKKRRSRRLNLDGTIITGALFSKTLQSCIEKFNRKFKTQLRVLPVESQFMGGGVTVAGLLAGQDIAAALECVAAGNFVIVPSEALARTNQIFIDDIAIPDLADRIGVPVYPGGRTVGDFFRLLFELSRL